MKICKGSMIISKANLKTNVDTMCEKYAEFVGRRAVPENKYRFYAYEFQEHLVEAYEEGTVAKYRLVKLFGNLLVYFRIPGPKANPFGENMDDEWYSRYYMRNYSKLPIYRYDDNKNENLLYIEAAKMPRKNSMIVQILAALVLAVIFYFIIRVLPESVYTTIKYGVIDPVFTKIAAVISGVATPMVFISAVGGIVGVGNSATVGEIGKKFISGMFLVYGVAAVAGSMYALVAYGISSIVNSGEAGTLEQITTLVVDMVPNNLFICFVEDNALQVIVLAVFVGIVLLILGEKASRVTEALEALEVVVNKMMLLVCKLLPVIVFCGVFTILFTDKKSLLGLYKVFMGFIICCAIVIVFVMTRARVITGASIGKLFKLQMPTTMMNLATSSQAGTMPENTRCCKEDMGIDGRLVDVCLPLGLVTYMPNGAVFLMLMGWSMGEFTGTPIDVLGLIKLAVVAVVVAIAAPPIPGSAFAVMPIVLSTCSIPMTSYSLAIVLGTVLGYFLPVLNGYCLQLETFITAYKLGKIDTEKFNRLKAK